MKVKFQDIKPAFEALRAIEQLKDEHDKPIRMFKGRLKAKYSAALLQQALQLAFEVLAKELQGMLREHTEQQGDKQIIKDPVAFREAEKHLLDQEVDILGEPIKATDIGAEALELLQPSHISDLGPFLVWDLV